jgi:hypothetical protein
VIVVDEAAMAGTRDIAAIVAQAADAGAKVLLVGDHHQLPEVAAGGAFRATLDVLGSRVVELTVNRRQQESWEQAALDQLRDGDVATAFAAYREHGRVVITDNPDDLRAIVLADWNATRATGSTLLLAGTRAQARWLNRHAREMRATGGELDVTTEVEVAGRRYVVGDEVVLRRNHPRQHLASGEEFAVDNGMRGTITAVTAEHVSIETACGRHVVLDRSYVEKGWLDHGYALNVHKSQGVTCDDVLLVGPEGLFREAAYVALSRARRTARIYVTTAQAAELTQRHQHGIRLPTEAEPDPEAELLARLQITRAKHLVTFESPDAARINQVATTSPATELLRRARQALHAERSCGVANPAQPRADLDAATIARQHLEVGRRVRAIDRDNVGHVLGIDDAAGSCAVQFQSVDGRTVIRSLDWAQLVVIDNPDPVTLTPESAETLGRRSAHVKHAQQEWARALATHGVQPGDADLYRRAIHLAADRAAHSLQAAPPSWLTTWLGDRPTTAAASAVWDDAATRIAHFRVVHDIPPTEDGIGSRPADSADSERWQNLMLRLLEDRVWLADHGTPQVTPLALRTPAELVDRRAELEQLMATAPDAQRRFIDQIARSQLNPAEMHEYLAAAMAVQDARRDWIIANWPHLVELEQVSRLIAAQEPLAHWPAAQPQPVRDVLEQLRRHAPEVDRREECTLADLDRREAEQDPVRRLEARRAHLDELARHAASPVERDAVYADLDATCSELRHARRARATDRAFEHYLGSNNEETRTTRITTLTHDTLTAQPAWVVDYIRRLHDQDQLTSVGLDEIAARITTAAVHQDLHGQLPPAWPDVPTRGVEPVASVPEAG